MGAMFAALLLSPVLKQRNSIALLTFSKFAMGQGEPMQRQDSKMEPRANNGTEAVPTLIKPIKSNLIDCRTPKAQVNTVLMSKVGETLVLMSRLVAWGEGKYKCRGWAKRRGRNRVHHGLCTYNKGRR